MDRKRQTFMGSTNRSGNYSALWLGCALSIFGALAAPVAAQAVPGLDAVMVASGLSQPVLVLAPPGDYGRLFIVRQTGQVHILNLATGNLNATPFLDIQSRLTNTGGEQGLLGMAFDRNYTSNGKFYLNFNVPGGAFGAGVTHISQFKVSANPDIADTTDEKLLLSFDQPQTNHNGGWIGFSPRPGDEDNLYISSGDGGNGDDQDGGSGHIEPGGNAQNLTTLLGKILRIHVDPVAGTASIPSDNPFVGSATARKEIFAYGLRNPFRCGFDRQSGTFFIGDVGQSAREEIDVQKPGNPGGGENYGWRLREGTIQTPGGSPPVGGAQPADGVDPVFDYPRSTGGTVIGGYVYRGRQIPALRGVYVFGDYLVAQIFTLNYDGTSASNFQTITAQLFPTTIGAFNLGNPSGFGEDANGELYITDIGAGRIFKIVPVTPNVVITSTKVVGGHALVTGFGVPFKNHTVQASPTLVEEFMPIGTVTAAGDGSFSFDDAKAASLTSRFYRVVYP